MSEITPSYLSNDPIKVTDSAILKVYELMQDEGNLSLKLRVYITGGGCSGFQYGFSFEEQANLDDFVIRKSLSHPLNHEDGDKKEEEEEEDGGEGEGEGGMLLPSIEIVIDAMSLQYLSGAEIDYKKDVTGEQFIIRGNPNAKTTCGCGSSFSVE